ncbi:Apoptosis regulator BAX [Oryzias melastigma]|uniref:Apoptosis regulator BAX n=1 Tax=Oryzias melastigma TaxID=30732 RepID=A0A834C1F2_ORYME|nr:Apoptosis regulator BAX [Oryzias melastigma]
MAANGGGEDITEGEELWGGKDVFDDPILEQILKQGAVILRGYVIESIKLEDPGLRVSCEDLGGSPNEQEDPKIKEVVERLLKNAENLSKNEEMQRLIKQTGGHARHIFMKVARKVIDDEIHWGRVVSLLFLASKFIHKALTTNDEETMRLVINWTLQVIRERLCFWLVQQGGWKGVIIRSLPWKKVTIAASIVLVAAFVYYWKTNLSYWIYLLHLIL